MMNNKITFIGCGKMGEAILSSVTKSGKYSISAVEKIADIRDKLSNAYGIDVAANIQATSPAAIYIMAVKPQSMKEALTELGEYLTGIEGKVIIVSIAAGITQDFLKNAVADYKDDVAIIRVMPNKLLTIRTMLQ
jgi:pyrroline-5-carboxylate reductase